ncbi:MAG: hypothetical protein AAF658_15590 [Myxococcota bacterium]
MSHPVFHESPQERDGVMVTPLGRRDERMRYFVYRDVLEELVFASEYEPEQVCAALLLGPFGIERQGPFLEITGFESLRYWAPEAATAREVFEHLHGAMLETFPKATSLIAATGLSAVGMFAHVPWGEGGLEGRLAKVHLSLFNVPYQCALVLDTKQDAMGLYGRAPGRGFFNTGFSLVG